MASTNSSEVVYVNPDPAKIRFLVDSDPDFVNNRRYGYSMKKLLEAHPEGLTNRLIAQALGITEAELASTYEEIVRKLRIAMGAIETND